MVCFTGRGGFEGKLFDSDSAPGSCRSAMDRARIQLTYDRLLTRLIDPRPTRLFGRERGVTGRAFEVVLATGGFTTPDILSQDSEPTALGLVGVLRMIDSEDVKRVPENT